VNIYFKVKKYILLFSHRGKSPCLQLISGQTRGFTSATKRLKCIFRVNYNGINETSKFWRRNYYQHIIRDNDELNHIREYIANNPANWLTNENNPDALKTRLKL